MTRPLSYDFVSVQSQVIYGSVGNNAAMPTLRALGKRALAVPTVLLSNTPFYDSNAGGVIADDWFAGFLRDIDARGALSDLKAIITGYLGSPAQASILRDWIVAMVGKHPQALVCIDPVLGDTDSGLYVDERLARSYREELIQIANVITPNHFELEYLSGGRPLRGSAALIAAAQSLLSDTLRAVVVTSAQLDDVPAGQLGILLVSREGVSSFQHEQVPCSVKGSGDIFNATLAASLVEGQSLRASAERGAARVIEAMKRTAAGEYGEMDC